MSQIIRKRVVLSRREYYQTHLKIINPLLPKQLTPKEVEVLAAFMCLQHPISTEPFSSVGRRMVRDQLSISFGGLSNYIKALHNKGFIYKDGLEKYRIRELLIPNDSTQLYQFKLEQNGEST